MKPSLIFATLSLVLASPQVFAKTELEMLRARCKEQERQIQQLEDEKARLSGNLEARAKNKPVETVSSAISTSGNAESPSAPGTATYKVKAGDSLAKISRNVGTSIEQLAKTNNVKTTAILQPGQELKVPTKTGGSNSAPASSPKPKVAADTLVSSGKTHELKQGETFSSLSKKYDISVDSLVAANPSLKPTQLRPGQTVNLSKSGSSSPATVSTPVSRPKIAQAEPKPAPRVAPQTMTVSTATPKSESKPAAPKPATTPAPAAEPEVKKEAPAPKTEKKIQPVIIDGEITYGEFAAKHGTNAERLNALNGLDLTTATVLAKGSELYVPAQP